MVSNFIINGIATRLSMMKKEGKTYALVAGLYEGLKIINVTDPSNSTQVGNLITQ